MAEAARDWAAWSLQRSFLRVIAVLAPLLVVIVVVAATFSWKVLVAAVSIPAALAATWLEQRDARKVAALVQSQQDLA